MIKQLDEAVSRLRDLPEDQQEAAAVLLFDFLEHKDDEIGLSLEQIAEIERRLAEDDVATDEEVQSFFDKIKR